MTTNKMLIDASHPEETRVVVLRDGRVEEFDYESTAREQLRGNIYLAKVTRVEPSLQAAFVDYGGNRHGFLAFSEIHPDYYQIPIADRQALLEEEAEQAAEDDEATDSDTVDADADGEDVGEASDVDEAADAESGEDSVEADENNDAEVSEVNYQLDDEGIEKGEKLEDKGKGKSFAERFLAPLLPAEYLQTSGSDDQATTNFDDAPEAHGLVEDSGIEEVNGGDETAATDEDESVDELGEGDDVMEEVPVRRRRRRRHYKIQEVIKRGQIILVQVVKEERGNKGAALTTYLSLAGRYTVLMPNTARGGGISRKITNATDRNHLRKIAKEIEVPEGMGLIIRTAGASRTMTQIKRDFEYLHRVWEKVRDLTMDSIAPCKVYEEGDLIKRSIRDLYSNEIDEILVSGESAHGDAKDFMKLIMPSHAKKVKRYKDDQPLFAKFDIERQLSAMFSPYVTLKSGGYLVINQTEALVAIDINSGKSTRQFSIEDTALNTNLEASEEIARQLKLRDLAGLIVIDYIDMEERSNNRAVERRLKQSLQGDRARIQVGRISHFGLLEMSRQRLRTGVLEGSTSPCPQCQGTGMIRSTESVALSVLRALEDLLISGEKNQLKANTSVDVALYILNSKRESLNDIEQRYGVEIGISANDKLQGGNFSIERVGEEGKAGTTLMTMNWGADAPEGATGRGRGGGKPRKRGGRKRTRDAKDGKDEKPKTSARGRRPKKDKDETADNKADDKADAEVTEASEATPDGETSDEAKTAKKPRRRGRRGGRKNRARREAAEKRSEESAEAKDGDAASETADGQNADTGAGDDAVQSADADGGEEKRTRKPRTRRSSRGRGPRKAKTGNGDASGDEKDPTASNDNSVEESTAPKAEAASVEEPKPAKRTRRPRRKPESAPEQKSADAGSASSDGPPPANTGSDKPDGPPKSGWWQKR